MPEFIVHSVAGSPYGRSVLITLEEKGAQYRFEAVTPGTMKSEPHLSRHPFGKVPVLEHDGFMLYETQAILRYLDRILPNPPLTPASAKDAARMDRLMNIGDCYLFEGVGNVIGFHRIVGPRLLGLTPDEGAIASAMPKAHAVFNELARLLGGQTYLVGDSVTLADIAIAPQMAFLQNAPEWEPLTGPHANLVAWLERMLARPSFQVTTWEQLSARAKAA